MISILLIEMVDAKTLKTKRKYPETAIVQSIIDHKQLQPFLHPELADRVPLVISDHLVGREIKLNKFGKQVRIESDNKLKGAYLRFTIFDCKNDNYCNIAFEYPVEGITGSTGVRINSDGSVFLEKTEINEQ